MRLLVVLDRPDTAPFTLKTVEGLAARLPFDEIRLLHPRMTRDPAYISPDEGLPSIEETRHFARDVVQRADALRRIATDWITHLPSSGLGSVDGQWLEVEGDIRMIVTREAMLADVVVHGRPRVNDPDYVSDAFGAILYDAEATLLIAPLQDFPIVGRKPVIGWRPSAALDKAIAAAMKLLETADRVTFLIGDEKHAETALPDFTRTLEAKGVTITVTRFQVENERLGEQIREHALAANADLLIMGSSPRRHFLEWLFGPPMQDMFTRATLPVLTHR
ncbi:universal stress protein [Acidomonas methanolica]|uniref:universal stress protein n=1 Tax=Acidomonas methanolica TaxID=437 RepID=UPI00211A09FD|nr:universal stress protein [Acidomonas methanolica]MCQ9154475.1 universal stress protein [Acidomonas methanolica]